MTPANCTFPSKSISFQLVFADFSECGASMAARKIEIRGNLESAYADVYTPEALAALNALAGLDADRKALMKARIERRAARARNKQRITFLDSQATIARANIRVQDARAGAFVGSEIPKDLQRQWIQGTGPAAK